MSCRAPPRPRNKDPLPAAAAFCPPAAAPAGRRTTPCPPSVRHRAAAGGPRHWPAPDHGQTRAGRDLSVAGKGCGHKVTDKVDTKGAGADSAKYNRQPDTAVTTNTGALRIPVMLFPRAPL